MELNDYTMAANTSQFAHTMLPDMMADELARQQFVKSFKLHIATRIAPGNKDVYNARVVPEYKKNHGRSPANRHEVRKEMQKQDYYQMWSALLRSSQELMWKSCQLPVERQLPELIKVAQTSGSKYSTLELDPDLEIPAYHRAVDIHCQPGGYHTEVAQNDVAAGAIYDRAVYLAHHAQ